LIDHTPKNEKLALYIGDAFDITAEYKTIESKVSERSSWEKRQIGLHNRKDSTVTIFADEKFPKWVNWKINDSTHPYVKKDAVAVRFTIEVPADSTVTLEYAVTQKW